MLLANPAVSSPDLPSENACDRSPITVGSLFAAIGGFCRAFLEVGATPVWANEKDRFAKETFCLNMPSVRFVHKDVEELEVDADRLEPVDILTAGFPCQPFSIAGEKRGFQDDRGLLFLHIIRIIREFGKRKPKVLLLENVRNFRAHDNGNTFRRVQLEIQKAGYWFPESNAKIMNTSEYTDIPQNRDRIFMIALSRDFFLSPSFPFPEPVSSASRKSVRSYLDLQCKAPAKYYFTSESQYYELFQEAIETGGREAIYQLRRNYVRRNMSELCFTLMANMGDGGHNQPVVKDRWGIRKLTPRECARLQGYKDEWLRFPEDVSDAQIYKQIGNSITVPLVIRIAEALVKEIKANAIARK